MRAKVKWGVRNTNLKLRQEVCMETPNVSIINPQIDLKPWEWWGPLGKE